VRWCGEVGLLECGGEEFLRGVGGFGDEEGCSRVAEEGGDFLEVVWREALEGVDAGDVFAACVVTGSVD